MTLFRFNLKIIVQIFFVTIFFSTTEAKNTDKFFNKNYISSYFSGILLLEENKYEQAHKFLKRLDGIGADHVGFSSKYLFTLINSGKFNEAYTYSKKLEKENLNIFESDLIIGVYHFKRERYDLAEKYFLKLKNKRSKFILNNFLSNSLLNWSSFKNSDLETAQNKIDKIDPSFKNLKNTQSVFLNCFFNSQKADLLFRNLIANKDIDFSRYTYFYGTFLLNTDKVHQAKQIVESALKLYPRHLLLNQLKLDLISNNYKYNFDCQNLSHIVAEIFYIAANVLSSQNVFNLSNFYLNLAKYLHNDFYSFDALIAENFYKIENYNQARIIYEKIEKKGEAYFWYAAKQKARILIKEKKKEEAIKKLTLSFQKLSNKNIYETFDYAQFLKSNKQNEEAIKYYTEIINKIKKDHPLYPEVADNRGTAYERIGEWSKAEKDLLSSLRVSPDQAYVINYLAYSWIEKGIKIDESLKMLEKANELKPNDPFIIDSLGWALFKLKKYKESKEYLQSAVKLMPADPIVNDHYGDVLWKSNDKIQARYFWNYVLNLKETEEKLKEIIKKKLISGL